jgi:hypothetical protein
MTPILLLLLLLVPPAAHAATPSKLWGARGELFKPNGRLLDFSYAGYMAGERALPDRAPTHTLTQFGRDNDFTGAMERAIREMRDGDVLRIPAGRYTLTRSLTINKAITIKGDGSGRVRITYPNGDGFAFNYQGANLFAARTRIADITGAARRGDNTISLRNSNAQPRVGAWVAVTMGVPSPSGSFFREMNMGVDNGCTDRDFCFRDQYAFAHVSRVAAVRGNAITLERPLPWALWASHRPKQLHRWAPELSDFGVEGLTIYFRAPRYRGHFRETGHEGINMRNVANAWIRDVVMIDTDYGVQVSKSAFVTVTDVTFNETPGRPMLGGRQPGTTGHHGISSNAIDSLFTRFTFNTKFIHDLTVDKFAQTSVFSDGKGRDINMDHHKAQNYGNLFTNIDLGRGARAFDSGGAGPRGLNAGPLNTYWHLKARGQIDAPEDDFGPGLNIVGLATARMPSLTGRITRTWWVEGGDVSPVNIHAAMRAVRMSQPTKVARALGGVVAARAAA